MDKLKYKPEFVLKNAIGFVEDDLEANREGILSEAQATWMRGRRTIWFIIGAIAGLIIWISVLRGIGESFQWFLSGCLVFPVAVNAAARFQNILSKNKVDMVEGRVHLDISNSFLRGSKYTVSIGSLVFPVTKRVFLAFKNTDPCAIYFTSYNLSFTDEIVLFRSRNTLSAEWINVKEAE